MKFFFLIVLYTLLFLLFRVYYVFLQRLDNRFQKLKKLNLRPFSR